MASNENTEIQASEEEAALLEKYFDRLWPIMRSITGSGVRQTLDILEEMVPFQRIEIPSGTQVSDWKVPPEWVFREAYIIGPDGRRVVDAADNNLHLVNYSIPFRGTLSRQELDAHLYSLPEEPDAIPYVTSYYVPRWGFCLTQRRRDALPDGNYQVVVDTDHIQGSITLAEAVLPGETDDEILLTSYNCHPSLANNELSGPLALAALYLRLARRLNRRMTYRFVLTPETIGSLSYLSVRGDYLRRRVKAGLVLTCIGDAGGPEGGFSYKASRLGDTLTDRAARHVLSRCGRPMRFMPFTPIIGSDERQYCSPGYNLPMGSVMRTMYQSYREYHTSLDDKSVISFPALSGSVAMCERLVIAFEQTRRYRNLSPYGEPQLGRRGMYGYKGAGLDDVTNALLWVLQYSDGDHDLLDIAELSGFSLDLLDDSARRAVAAGLLEPI